MTIEPRTLQLQDRRQLRYAEYGTPSGVPVFYFHGIPGSYLLFDEQIESAQRLGLRLIVAERPGYGASDYQPGRKLLDWAADMTALADALGMNRFAVLGVSGGGPYAAACAYQIPDRLTQVVLLSSVAPVEAGLDSVLPRDPEQIQARVEALALLVRENPDALFEGMFAEKSEAEREALRNYSLADLREAFRNGIQGCVDDILIGNVSPWGFSLEAIDSHIEIWHGDADKNVPVQSAYYLHEHMLESSLHILPGVAHQVPSDLIEVILTGFLP